MSEDCRDPEERLHWDDPCPKPCLNLRNARVGNLQDDKQAWPEHITLEGFTYTHLGGIGGEQRQDMRNRPIEWWRGWLSAIQSIARSLMPISRACWRRQEIAMAPPTSASSAAIASARSCAQWCKRLGWRSDRDDMMTDPVAGSRVWHERTAAVRRLRHRHYTRAALGARTGARRHGHPVLCAGSAGRFDRHHETLEQRRATAELAVMVFRG